MLWKHFKVTFWWQEGCVDLGAFQEVCCNELFFSTFPVFMESLTLWSRAHRPVCVAPPFGRVQCQQRNVSPRPPWRARPSPGKRHGTLVASVAMAGHAGVSSKYQGCHRKPSCRQALMALTWELTCRQLCREPEQKGAKCPCLRVYWGNRCINISETLPGQVEELAGLLAISGRVRVQNT